MARFMREPGIGAWGLAQTATCWFEMQHVLQGNKGNEGNQGKWGTRCVGRDAEEDGIAGKNLELSRLWVTIRASRQGVR